MAHGELESVPDNKAVVMTAQALCAEAAWEDECQRRVPELADIAEWSVAENWRDFLAMLDDEDPAYMFDLLEEDSRELDETDEYEAAGFIETERGVVFAGFPWDATDEDEENEDE